MLQAPGVTNSQKMAVAVAKVQSLAGTRSCLRSPITCGLISMTAMSASGSLRHLTAEDRRFHSLCTSADLADQR